MTEGRGDGSVAKTLAVLGEDLGWLPSTKWQLTTIGNYSSSGSGGIWRPLLDFLNTRLVPQIYTGKTPVQTG